MTGYTSNKPVREILLNICKKNVLKSLRKNNQKIEVRNASKDWLEIEYKPIFSPFFPNKHIVSMVEPKDPRKDTKQNWRKQE